MPRYGGFDDDGPRGGGRGDSGSEMKPHHWLLYIIVIGGICLYAYMSMPLP